MYYIGYIYLVNFLLINVKSEDCNIDDTSKVDEIVIHSQKEMIKSDPKNFTDHLQENLREIRENYETGILPANESIYYYLFTTVNENDPYNLTNYDKTIQNSPYDKNNPTILVIHGYVNKLYLHKGSIAELKTALLNERSYNVIIVDYTELNNSPFLDSIKKSYSVANQVAKLLTFLKDNNYIRLYDLHIIAESLGAQIAGNTGHKLPGIGRISAQDAAGDVFYDFPDDLRLDRSDANFVDAIHTADDSPFPKGLGFYYPIGHLDFYPNGGKFQPGCDTVPVNSSISPELSEALHTVCMHVRATKLYTESICSKRCLFIGVMCKNYEDFKNGKCTKLNSITALMGQPATKPVRDLPKNEMFFLDTNSHYPYCKIDRF